MSYILRISDLVDILYILYKCFNFITEFYRSFGFLVLDYI